MSQQSTSSDREGASVDGASKEGEAALASASEHASDDLRGFLQVLKSQYPRELITVNDDLSGDWELAAFTGALEQRMRIPVIEYASVTGSSFPVVHNVCSSLGRIARVLDCSARELEERLARAYDCLIPPELQSTGPVRDVIQTDAEVDLTQLPSILYTDTQTRPYISAACVVARDSESGAMNISFNRLMVQDRNTLAIYMTPGSDLDVIFQGNKESGCDTPVAAFLGSHPLWSLGSLASGPLSLDEYSVIGGLLGKPLPVVPGLLDDSLLVPANAEFAFEGVLSCSQEIAEGPFGEAFGYVSQVAQRPVMQARSLSHRHGALFQDIVPGRIEHMTMTGVAIKVQLQKTLIEQFDCVERVHLPAPMTVYLALAKDTASEQIHELLRTVLEQQRFVKHVVAFDSETKLDNAGLTQRAMAMHVQVDRDLVMLPNQPGNGLDPSERNGRTVKWGIDATATTVAEGLAQTNTLPEDVLNRLDVDGIWLRAQDSHKTTEHQAIDRPPSTFSK